MAEPTIAYGTSTTTSSITTTNKTEKPNRTGGVKEADVGITQFLSSISDPTPAILKHRFRDFIVNEIDNEGKVAHLTDLSVPADLNVVPLEAKPEENVGADEAVQEMFGSGLEELKTLTDEESANVVRKIMIGAKLLKIDGDEDKVEGEAASVVQHLFPKDADKQKRTALHQLIREKFGGYLVSDTQDGCVRVVLRSASTTRSDNNNNRNPNNKRRNSDNRNGGANKKIKVDWRNNNQGKGKLSKEEKKGRKCMKFVLYKENVETHFVLSKLSSFFQGPKTQQPRNANAKKVQISIAGTKDKRGVTVQFATINKDYSLPVLKTLQNAVTKTFPSDNVQIGNFEPCAMPLKLGDLSGNEFTIILREISGPLDKLKERLEHVKRYGFVNYFGLQRFGCRANAASHMLGEKLLLNHHVEFVKMLLSDDPQDIDRAEQAKTQLKESVNFAKSITIKNRKKLEEACNMMPPHMTAEKSILRALVSKSAAPGKLNISDVVDSISHHLKTLYLHAFQSYVWNFVASERIKVNPLDAVVGDLVFGSDRNSVIMLTDANVAQYKITDIVLPLPGFDVKYPEGEVVNQKLYEKFIPGGKMELLTAASLSGGYRKLVCVPSNFSSEEKKYKGVDTEMNVSDYDKLLKITGKIAMHGDENEVEKIALQLKFSLPQSSYATMLFREVMRVETDLESVKKMAKND